MGGFVPIDGKYIDAYAVCLVRPSHAAGSVEKCELMLTCGHIVYANMSPGEAIGMIIAARAECEGRS